MFHETHRAFCLHGKHCIGICRISTISRPSATDPLYIPRLCRKEIPPPLFPRKSICPEVPEAQTLSEYPCRFFSIVPSVLHSCRTPVFLSAYSHLPALQTVFLHTTFKPSFSFNSVIHRISSCKNKFYRKLPKTI